MSGQRATTSRMVNGSCPCSASNTARRCAVMLCPWRFRACVSGSVFDIVAIIAAFATNLQKISPNRKLTLMTHEHHGDCCQPHEHHTPDHHNHAALPLGQLCCAGVCEHPEHQQFLAVQFLQEQLQHEQAGPTRKKKRLSRGWFASASLAALAEIAR